MFSINRKYNRIAQLAQTGVLLLFILCGGCTSQESGVVVVPETIDGASSGIGEIEPVFGFEGENRYSYAPSVIDNSDGTSDIFFCGNPTESIFVDHIYHIELGAEGRTQEKSVLQPGVEGTWDDQHVCDPSVVAGDFVYKGTQYKYALFYLGSSKRHYYNEIGVAFSNRLDGNDWVKYPDPIVGKTWAHEEDQPIGQHKAWGVGQPSVISLNGKNELLLIYTVGDIDGTRIEWAKIDLGGVESFTLSDSGTVPTRGLFKLDYSGTDIIKNSDFALDKENDKIVLVRPVMPNPSDYPAFLAASLEIASMNLSDFWLGAGTWTQVLRINPGETGYPRNHNAGLARNEFGEVGSLNGLEVFFTTSEAYPSVTPKEGFFAEWSYRIWKATIRIN